MIDDIKTFLEIVANDHLYRPEGKKLPDNDIREIEELIQQLEAFIDRMIDGGSKNYGELTLLSDRIKNFLICLLLDEVGALRGF